MNKYIINGKEQTNIQAEEFQVIYIATPFPGGGARAKILPFPQDLQMLAAHSNFLLKSIVWKGIGVERKSNFTVGKPTSGR